MELQIKEEFASLLLPLSDNELKSLKDSLLKQGCSEPIIVWNDYIIDGHYRYKICKEHNIEFEAWHNDSLKTEQEVKVWIINKELNKYSTGRQLSSARRLALSYKLVAVKGRGNDNV